MSTGTAGRTAVLTPLDIACGTVFGKRVGPPLPTIAASVTPRSALEAVIAEGLQRPPCVISFSGGRDSSAVLAVAAHVARREGLALPIPMTLTFPDAAGTDERTWQELVISHLGLPDWDRPEFHDELDIVGPIATDALSRKGLHWPFNTYFHEPIFERARGGTVLTGVGGDELFSTGMAWQRINLVASKRAKRLPLDPIRYAVARGPFVGRRAVMRHRHRNEPMPTWLTPDAADAVRRELANKRARETASYATSIRRLWWDSRARVVGAASLDALASDHDVRCVSPLSAPSFLAAVLRDRGRWMFSSRTQAMRWIVGDLLPDELLSRDTKAFFDEAFFLHHARSFAEQWDGTGVDSSIVKPEELKRIWTNPESLPDARSFTLMQSAWLAARSA